MTRRFSLDGADWLAEPAATSGGGRVPPAFTNTLFTRLSDGFTTTEPVNVPSLDVATDDDLRQAVRKAFRVR